MNTSCRIDETPAGGAARVSDSSQTSTKGEITVNNSTATTQAPLVALSQGQPVTTSLAIAEGVGNPHSSVIKLIRQNTSDLEEFGNIGFEIQNSTSGAGRPTEYAILNEQQSTLERLSKP